MKIDRVTIDGVFETLVIYEDKISLTPRGLSGFINKGLKGTKEIPFSSITAIQLKTAGAYTNGYIQFSLLGGSESKGGLIAAIKDENSFLFKKQENLAMENLRTFIMERLNKNEKDGPSRVGDKSEELIRLTELLKAGSIDEAEFKELKRQTIAKAG